MSFDYGCIKFTDSLNIFQNSIEGIAKFMLNESTYIYFNITK